MGVKQPDPHAHLCISLVKSAIRAGAGLLLLGTHDHNLQLAGLLLIFAEILGVFEELV